MISVAIDDYVRLMDSPLDRLKKGARGLVIKTFTKPDWEDYHLCTVRFKVAGEILELETGSNRFVIVGHKNETDEVVLDDAENNPHEAEAEEVVAAE